MIAVAAVLAGSVGCSSRPPAATTAKPGWTERGNASWYGEPYHGRRTASGEVYDMHELTAAHRTLPFGTVVRVRRRDTGAHVEVRINDRGPFVRGRIIDLSYAAARAVGLDVDGVAPVEIRVVGRGTAPRTSPPPPPGRAEADCFWVQVGAFSDASNAGRARDRLRAAGHPAVVIEGPGGLERVRVGPFEQREEAERTAARLRPEWPPAQVVACGG